MKRPCICGCSYNKHEEIKFDKKLDSLFYCMGCQPPAWCYHYRPIGNLEYLEWLIYGRNDL